MQKLSAFTLNIAGIPLRFSTRFNVSNRWIGPFIIEDKPVNGIPIIVPEAVYKAYCAENNLNEITVDEEFFLLHLGVSEVLLAYGRCLFHGVAFIWHGKAFLLTAPSGTGKSTQFRNWKLLYRKDVQIINGDKPVLEFRKDKAIIVHPSPWNGKEDFHGYRSAPLGGIIYLQQGKENKIERMNAQNAVLPIYKQFLFLPEKEEYIHAVCRMEDTLLQNVPVWKLINKGDLKSAQLTHDVLLKYLEG